MVAGRPSATFSARRSILEQREMLERHADAQIARLGRAGRTIFCPIQRSSPPLG